MKDVSATRSPARLGEGQSRNKLAASGQIVLNDMKGVGRGRGVGRGEVITTVVWLCHQKAVTRH